MMRAFFKCQLAACVVEFPEAVEAVARIAHHLAGLVLLDELDNFRHHPEILDRLGIEVDVRFRDDE
jgi:hypothetical protein